MSEEATDTAAPAEDQPPSDGDEQIKGMSLAMSTGAEEAVAAAAASSTVGGELSDPAILVVKENKYRYDREELLRLRMTPLSQRKPDFLDTNEVSPTIWDPTRWNFDRKKTETPTTENGPRSAIDLVDHRRRPGDPRERIRKENDGIVLSPQRRSFNSGCFVPMRESANNRPTNRPHSPLGGKSEPNHIGGVREIPSGTRRIGSGRILRDAWDFGDKSGVGDSNNDGEGGGGGYGGRGGDAGSGNGGGGFNRNNQQNNRTINNDPNNGNERRSFGRDFDMSRDKDGMIKDARRSGSTRFGDRRRGAGDGGREIEEPEWFSSGPISQHDTIELRGFDESDKFQAGKKKMSPSQAKRARDWFKKKSEVLSVAEEKDNDSSATESGGGRGGGTPIGSSGANDKAVAGQSLDSGSSSTASKEKVIGVETSGGECSSSDNQKPPEQKLPGSTAEKPINDNSFNFDDILKADTIPGFAGLLSNGVGGDGDSSNTKSRFTKWFSSAEPRAESRRSSVQDEAVIKNLLKELTEPSVTIPGESETYFAPISPAANTAQQQRPNDAKAMNIMQMLHREANGKPQAPGRIMNLVDLEAKMRQQNSEPQHKHAPKTDDDLSAFNRLMAQVSGGHAVTANGPMKAQAQPMSILEFGDGLWGQLRRDKMLNHSQQQDEQQARMAQLLAPSSPASQNPHMPSDPAARLQKISQMQQQQQVEMLTTLVKAGMHMQLRASPLAEMGVQQSRELLSRPEAQAILQGLKVGDITPQHLYQQLANPALQPRHREMLMTIIKVQGNGGGGGNGGGIVGGGGMGPSPRVLSPVVAPHPLFQQQQQQQAQQQQAAQQAAQQQQQLRISPLPPNAYCVSPIMATSPNTLTVPAMHQRIPSPRELQVHTQNILQRALIKKKLEEQQENFRKKQEMQQGGQSPNNNNSQPVKNSVSSPTPLAFTPTSVLRKMTADKEEVGSKDAPKMSDNGMGPKLGSSGGQQGRAVTGMKPQTQQQVLQQQPSSQPQQLQQQQSQQQQQQSQMGQWPFGLNMKQAGRPIVKANNFQQQQQQDQFFNHHHQQQQQQQAQQQKLYNQLQQQRNKGLSQQQQSQQTPAFHGGHGSLPHVNHHQYSNANQQFSQLTQQQLRAQHQQHARPSNVPQQQQGQQQQQNNHIQGMNFANQTGTASWQQFLNPNQSRGNQLGRGGLTDGDLSPTSNQLTRWFSPDLLERARVGELPSTAGLGQPILSLEEIERLTAAPPVHN